jgi:hypothetical protein
MSSHRSSGFFRSGVLTFVVLVLLATTLWWVGADFYVLPMAKRPDHPMYRKLSATGTWGLTYGAVGTLLIFTNLLYLVRRKLAAWRLGSLAGWLNLHVVTGLAGSLLIVFHSAFQVRNGVAAISAVSLAVVVFTGVVGRYLHTLTPTVDTVRMAKVFLELDALVPRLGANLRAALKRMPVTRIESHLTLARALAKLPRWWRESHARRQVMNVTIQGIRRGPPSSSRPSAEKLLRELRQLAVAEVHTVMANSLLQVWRPMHRFFAISMLLAVAVHIGIAWYYGYRWIF